MKTLIKRTFVIIAIITTIIILISVFNSIPSRTPEQAAKEKAADSLHHLWSVNQTKNIQKQSDSTWSTPKSIALKKEHPGWTLQECYMISNDKIWIGMSYEMLKYLKGKPNHINTSNYGRGNEYQWCWDEGSPRCFYGKADGIVTGFN